MNNMAHETAATPAAVVPVEIRDFILERFPLARKKTLSDTDLLLENGILDSLGILDLVAFLEQRYCFAVSDEDLIPDHFKTIQQISVFVHRKVNGSN